MDAAAQTLGQGAAPAPKTLAELAALASIEVGDLKAFTPADFEELAKELAIPVAAKVKLRGLHEALISEPAAQAPNTPAVPERSSPAAPVQMPCRKTDPKEDLRHSWVPTRSEALQYSERYYYKCANCEKVKIEYSINK